MIRVRRRRAQARAGAVAAAAALTLLPPQASAHGGMWRANRILVAPDDPDRIVLQSDLRGPIFSTDGGKTWRWICAETYGRSSISAAPVAMLPQPGGRLLVASYGRGLLISDGDPCTFEAPAGFAPKSVRDVTASGATLLALGADESEEAVRDVLFASEDGGRTFAQLGTPLPADFTATSLRGRGDRLYVAGLRERGWTVARSDDRGKSWQFGALLPFESRVGWSASFVDVGSDDRDLLFVMRDESGWNLEQPSGDQLSVSEDGGLTFRPVFSDGRPLYGFARSPDGETVLVAGESGLFRASLAAALAQGNEAFEALANTPFYGLAWTAAGIYAGMEEFSSPRDDAYSVGFSGDRGATFTRRMSLCDAQPATCAADTPAGDRCPAVFSDDFLTGGGFKEDFLLSDRCLSAAARPASAAPVARTDAGDSPASAMQSGRTLPAKVTESSADERAASSGGCGLSGRGEGAASGVLALLAALGLLRRRRVRSTQR